MITKKEKGFTLIEIIVTLAIVGLLAVVFLPLFSMTFRMIYAAGHRNINTFQSQMEAEQKIGENIIIENAILEIEFEGIDPLQISGEEFVEGEMRYFIPN